MMSLVAFAGMDNPEDRETFALTLDGQVLLRYQSAPMTEPKGGEAFQGSDFIHPLKTPSGFVVTGLQPDDHLHHFGLWWPWKYVETEGRQILCWELQEGEGLIRAEGAEKTADGFAAKSVYLDRKHQNGARVLIKETLHVSVSDIFHPVSEVQGYWLDLEIIHENPMEKPLTVVPYRYSGFALRATPFWNKDNSRLSTSEGKDYDASNFSRARWVSIEGENDLGGRSGVVMMSHPGNHDHPETLRTWDKQTENGAIFVNFNPVKETAWVLESGKSYSRKYRIFVYDGELPLTAAEQLWLRYQ